MSSCGFINLLPVPVDCFDERDIGVLKIESFVFSVLGVSPRDILFSLLGFHFEKKIIFYFLSWGFSLKECVLFSIFQWKV